MPGPVIIVIVLVFALPIGTLIGGAVLSMGLGWALKTEVDATHEGSELLELNT